MKKGLGLLVFAVFVISGLLFISCEKEKTETNMIIRSWTLKTKTVAGVNVATNCEQDAKWDFKSDGSYVIKDNCDDTKTGTWKLADDGKTLTLNSVTAFKVIENSIINLVIEMQVGDLGLARWTFK
ncbi:MAG TPA: lipocalin family protein [Dysgonamonadaceae bacterium]|nr:lipocalin family protein [Dysgonamonadaceae bacterium]